MKIAIISDLHLGYGEGERFEEAFENTEKCFSLAIEKGAELILLPGDIYDSNTPSTETVFRSFKSFSKAKQGTGTILKRTKNEAEELIQTSHIPLIAIHGTHEFRGKDFTNILQLLEAASFLTYFHAETIEPENSGVVFHGLGGVPEKKAKDVLKAWNPKPVSGKKNIIIFHQSFKEFLPFEDEMVATLSLSDIPEGFDLAVCGHMHWNSITDSDGKKLLVPGSTIITQMKKLEAEKPKGFYLLETESMKPEFVEIPDQRKLVYRTVSLENTSREEAENLLKEELSSIFSENFAKKPLVRIVLKGSLAKGVLVSDINTSRILEAFSDKAFFSVSLKLGSASFEKKIGELRELQKSKKSVVDLGLDLLEKNISQTSFNKAFDHEQLFAFLEEGDIEKAFSFLYESSRKPLNNSKS